MRRIIKVIPGSKTEQKNCKGQKKNINKKLG